MSRVQERERVPGGSSSPGINPKTGKPYLPDDLRKSKNESGFMYVVSAVGGKRTGHSANYQLWTAFVGSFANQRRGPCRRTPEEAAQDACNILNGLTVPVQTSRDAIVHVLPGEVDSFTRGDHRALASRLHPLLSARPTISLDVARARFAEYRGRVEGGIVERTVRLRDRDSGARNRYRKLMELEAEERGSLPCMACSVDYVGPLGPKGLLLMEAAHRIPLSMPVAREEATIEDFWTACKPCNALQEVDKLGFDSFLERYEGVLFGTFEVAV